MRTAAEDNEATRLMRLYDQQVAKLDATYRSLRELGVDIGLLDRRVLRHPPKTLTAEDWNA
jgi:hypothetical protein